MFVSVHYVDNVHNVKTNRGGVVVVNHYFTSLFDTNGLLSDIVIR